MSEYYNKAQVTQSSGINDTINENAIVTDIKRIISSFIGARAHDIRGVAEKPPSSSWFRQYGLGYINIIVSSYAHSKIVTEASP